MRDVVRGWGLNNTAKASLTTHESIPMIPCLTLFSFCLYLDNFALPAPSLRLPHFALELG